MTWRIVSVRAEALEPRYSNPPIWSLSGRCLRDNIPSSCGPQKLRTRSCRDFFQPVFVMQTAQHSSAGQSIALWESVSMLLLERSGIKRRRDTRSQAHVNATMVVMAYPVIENVLEMPLSQGYEEIQTLPADRSDQTFAN